MVQLFLVGIQLMRRFLRDNKLRIIDFPDEYNEFRHLLLGRQNGTLGEMLNAERPCLDRSSLVYRDLATVNFTLSDNAKELRELLWMKMILLN